MTAADADARRPRRDWARFLVRFACGAVFGSVAGFGFWVQMCRPPHARGLWEWFPQRLAAWLGGEAVVDSGVAGLAVVVVFSLASGLIVGLKRPNPR